jgi:prepilin-type N-terminal cleavage/methylation domain-containing protein
MIGEKNMKNRSIASRGFTIVEVIIVVAVISIITSITVVSFFAAQQGSRDSVRSTKTNIIANALEDYYEVNNEYPSVASLVGQNTQTVKSKLGLTDTDSLIFPLNTNSGVTSIVASNPSKTQVAYVASTTDPAANAQCQSDVNGYCDAFELRYNKEMDNQLVVVKSKRNDFVAVTEPNCASSCLVPSSVPTVSGQSISTTLARFTAAVVTCSQGTAEYKIRNAGSASLPAWSTVSWTTNRVKDINPGSDTTLYFQAMTRCVSGSDSSPSSQSTVSQVNVGTAPSAPVVSATAVSSTSIQLSWGAVSGANSYAVTGAGNASSCTTSPCTVTGLTASTSYTFNVTATNNFGTSPQGSASATTQAAPCVIPSAPSLTIGTVTSSSIALSWGASTGNSPITYYVSYGTTSSANTTTVNTTSTSTTLTGLNSSTTYYMRIYAGNSCVSSAYSATVNRATSAPPCTVPGVPTSFSANSSTTSSVSLSWGAPSGTAPITYYVSYGTTSSANTSTTTTTSTSISVGSLSSATTYYFRVYAGNSCGSSAYTATVSRATNGVAPSSTGASFQRVHGSSNAIDVSWSASSGTAPISYTVWYGSSAPGTTQASCSSAPCRITGLPSRTFSQGYNPWYFRVVASNAYGSSTSTVTGYPWQHPDAPATITNSGTDGFSQANITYQVGQFNSMIGNAATTTTTATFAAYSASPMPVTHYQYYIDRFGDNDNEQAPQTERAATFGALQAFWSDGYKVAASIEVLNNGVYSNYSSPSPGLNPNMKGNVECVIYNPGATNANKRMEIRANWTRYVRDETGYNIVLEWSDASSGNGVAGNVNSGVEMGPVAGGSDARSWTYQRSGGPDYASQRNWFISLKPQGPNGGGPVLGRQKCFDSVSGSNGVQNWTETETSAPSANVGKAGYTYEIPPYRY